MFDNLNIEIDFANAGVGFVTAASTTKSPPTLIFWSEFFSENQFEFRKFKEERFLDFDHSDQLKIENTPKKE